jgi:hypothetical protein
MRQELHRVFFVQQLFCCYLYSLPRERFAEPLPRNGRRVAVMKQAVEMGSGALIQLPNFIKFVSGIRKLVKGGSTDTEDGSSTTLL